MKNLSQILKDILQLPKYEQEQLVKRINLNLDDASDSAAQLIEVRHSHQKKEKFTCPHSSGKNIVGHGNYKGRKRYKCKTCKKTFNDLTGTSVSCIHKKDEWKSYQQYIANNLTLRESAKQVGVQNINNIHHLLKYRIKQFNGISSGYLQNYMNWFRVLRIVGSDIGKYLEYALASNSAFVSVKNIKPQYIKS